MLGGKSKNFRAGGDDVGAAAGLYARSRPGDRNRRFYRDRGDLGGADAAHRLRGQMGLWDLCDRGRGPVHLFLPGLDRDAYRACWLLCADVVAGRALRLELDLKMAARPALTIALRPIVW